MSNNAFDTQEDEKENVRTNTLSRYKHNSNNSNPLVTNKGIPSFRKNSCIHQIIPIVNIPVTLQINDPQAEQVIKKESVCSQASEGHMSNTSEFNNEERLLHACKFFQLPLFEIHNTMQILVQKRTKIIEEKNEPEPEPESKNCLLLEPALQKNKFKSRSLVPGRLESFEQFETNISPQQYAFLKSLYAFKTNYLFHVLSMPEIYFQYVAISKTNMGFMETSSS